MTPTEQDNELREQLLNLRITVWKQTNLNGQANLDHDSVDEILQLITADRKRVALEARIEVCDKYLSFRATSDTEYEAIQWLDFQKDELLAELKAQQEEPNDKPE